MNELLDPNEVAATALSNLISRAFNSVSLKATTAAKNSWSKIFEDFSPFMKDAYQKNAFVRLLSQKDRDVELYSVYVNSSFMCENKSFNDDELIYSIREGRNLVINGNGGAGKTFFMRHLWLSLFKEGEEFTPIFIELRKLNDLTSTDLKSFIRLSISRKKELDDSLFSYFCESGRFCFILDGFDEIVQSQRDFVQRQILQLSSDYRNCRFVVSSRYESRFAGWQNFDLYESQPFTLVKVKKLIELVPFDQSAKRLFQKQLDKDFYEQNKSFLSNPLLAIMMLMTFKENMDIPRRMNIFYDQAFTTLFQWHDATKAFNREKTLDIDEFQRSFGMFCLLSYHQEKFEFTKSEVIDFITKSNKICGINKDAELVLVDYEQTVNLLRQDGLKYVFIHRSFQEYFCSYAMIRINPSKFAEIFSAIRKRYNDNVLIMCFEMNKSIVIESYVRPLYQQLTDDNIFKLSSGDKFYLLNHMDVKYNLRTSSRLAGSYQSLGSMGFSINEPVEEFLNNVSRLMGYKNDRLSYSGTVMFHNDIFSLFDEVVKTVKSNCGFRCVLKFDPDEVLVDVTGAKEDEDDKLDEHAVEESMILALQRKQEDLAIIEKRMSDEMEKLRKWCAREIDKNNKREKSLDAILGL